MLDEQNTVSNKLKLSTLLQGGFILISANILNFIKPIIYGYYSSPQEFLLWSSVFLASAYYYLFGAFGFQQLATRNIALETAKEGTINYEWSKVTYLLFSIGLIPFSIIYLLIFEYDNKIEVKHFLFVIYIFSQISFNVSLFTIITSDPKRYSTILFLKNLSALILSYWFLIYSSLFFAVLAEALITLTFSAYYLTKVFKVPSIKWELLSRKNLKESLTLLLATGSSGITTQMDRTLSIKVLSALGAGIYGFGLIFVSIGQQIQYLISVLVIPVISRQFESGLEFSAFRLISSLMLFILFIILSFSYLMHDLITFYVQEYFPEYSLVISAYWFFVLITCSRASELASVFMFQSKLTDFMLKYFLFNLSLTIIIYSTGILVFEINDFLGIAKLSATISILFIVNSFIFLFIALNKKMKLIK